MIKLKFVSGIAVLCAAAIAVLPWPLNAQSTNKPAAEKKETRTKKPAVTPFRGKLKAVDKNAKTISVGELTLQITSETKILKAEKPAVLEDGVMGEIVSGAYQKAEDGKLHATKITFGTKAEKSDPKKEKAKM